MDSKFLSSHNRACFILLSSMLNASHILPIHSTWNAKFRKEDKITCQASLSVIAIEKFFGNSSVFKRINIGNLFQGSLFSNSLHFLKLHKASKVHDYNMLLDENHDTVNDDLDDLNNTMMLQEILAEEIILMDPRTDRTIRCSVQNKFLIDSVHYVICTPVEQVILISMMNPKNENEMIGVTAPEQLEMLFSPAQKKLIKSELQLKKTAFVFTLDGIPHIFGHKEFGDNDDDRDEEVVSVIDTFFFKDEKYTICQPDVPLVFLARKKTSDSSDYILPPPDELERVSPIVESKLEETFSDATPDI